MPYKLYPSEVWWLKWTFWKDLCLSKLFANRQVFIILRKVREPTANSHEISGLVFKILREIEESQLVLNMTTALTTA